ncbi:putative defense protein 1 [Microplitis mediator]|uniref:putative defense protein 1 n=1 Tax=Microplitis mediator TaxID=375433 RepID=UPI002553117E|nr:putative defense protein 1 [Microplitis mediator]
MTQHVTISLVVSVIVGLLALTSVNGFPDGAPVDVCVKERPNQPYHGQVRAQPANTSPYQIIASSNSYGPGKQISVSIRGDTFKGFFIQARDSRTHAWIGSFAPTPNTKVFDECSAVTHADPKDKQEATLIWNSPAKGQGQVYFTGSVLKNYSTFWAELISQ